MTNITRRQVAAGLFLIAISATTQAAQGARQHRPGSAQQPRQHQPRPMPPKKGVQGDMAHDRLMMQDRDRLQDRDIYGGNLMSAEERDRYRDRLQKAENDQDWARIRAEHEKEMQARSRMQGVNLDPPVYGQHMMTTEERSRYTKRLQDAKGETEREMIRNEHREFIQKRARDLGMSAPPVEGQ